MRLILIAAAVGLLVGLFVTPLLIRALRGRGYAQAIRDETLGYPVPEHSAKKGTPSMGGIVLVGGTVLGYFSAHLLTGDGPTASGMLVLFLMTALGAVGLVDDSIKIFRQRSTGLRAKTKLLGQLVIAVAFAWMALQFPDSGGLTPASQAVSFVRDTALVLPIGLYLVWIYVLVASTANGVNLTDGLDGLATGASIIALGTYVLLGVWEHQNACAVSPDVGCYVVRDPLDLGVVAAGLLGSCVGFLWWNTSPAQIFMGDTGAFALGGGIAGLAILLRTELLLLFIGGLFVIVTMSVILQVVSYRTTGRRIFLMSPLQHHFELKGWHEVTIVVRFWIIAGLLAGLGLGLYYAEWLGGGFNH